VRIDLEVKTWEGGENLVDGAMVVVGNYCGISVQRAIGVGFLQQFLLVRKQGKIWRLPWMSLVAGQEPSKMKEVVMWSLSATMSFMVIRRIGSYVA